MRQIVVDGNPAFCIALLDSHHISKTSYTYRRPILIFSTFIGTFGQCISLTGLENELVVHTNSKCCLARAAWSTGLTEKYATINGVVRNKYERNTLRCVPCPYVSSSPDIWVNWDFLCAKTLASWKWPGQGYSVMSLDSCRFMLAQNASADVSGKGVDGENMGVGSKSDVVGKTDFTRTCGRQRKQNKDGEENANLKSRDWLVVDDGEDDHLHRSSIFKGSSKVERCRNDKSTMTC